MNNAIKSFTCSGCDLETKAAGDLPKGWYTQTSGKLGTLLRCPKCAEKNATRIATEHLTTDQILAGDTITNHADDAISGAAQNRLKTIIQRIDRLLDDAEGIANDIREVKAEAKAEGFEVKILARVVRELRKDKIKREEETALFDLYMSAAGEA